MGSSATAEYLAAVSVLTLGHNEVAGPARGNGTMLVPQALFSQRLIAFEAPVINGRLRREMVDANMEVIWCDFSPMGL